MNVKGIIKEKGWTIERLAAEIPNRNGEKGVSPITLHQNLSRNPTVDTLRKIADTIGCKIGDFFRDEISDSVFVTHPDSCTCPKCGARLRLTVAETISESEVENE